MSFIKSQQIIIKYPYMNKNMNSSCNNQALANFSQKPQSSYPQRSISQARSHPINKIIKNKTFQELEQPQDIIINQQIRVIIKQDTTNKIEKNNQNGMYLSKMKNTRKMIVNEGISTFSPERDKKIQLQMKGLNHFSNILLKRIERKFNKVSFSQFLQIKKEKDFESKFKFIYPQKTKYNIKSKNEVEKNIQSFCLGNKNEVDVKKLSKSLVLQQNQRGLARSRFRQSSKAYQRYPSNLSESYGMRGSLEITKMPLL